jgi:hypothetical protein
MEVVADREHGLVGRRRGHVDGLEVVVKQRLSNGPVNEEKIPRCRRHARSRRRSARNEKNDRDTSSNPALRKNQEREGQGPLVS